jgi:hypothetical protein
VVIGNDIGTFFKTWNIVEYKSLGDSFSVADFHKVLAYAYLYIFFEPDAKWEEGETGKDQPCRFHKKSDRLS